MGRTAGLEGQVGAGQAVAPAGEAVTQIPLHLVDPNPFQPRAKFGEDEILELAESIRSQGLLQPITVRKYQDRYQIIAGERRVRACRLLNQETIAALVKDKVSDRRMATLGLVENIQREDLDPVEEAVAMRQLLEQYDYTHEKLAEELGRSRSAISNALRLLSLPEEVLGWVREGKLTAGHARALLADGLGDPAALAREIIEK
ncbi:MAG: ParB/RepB/Spo0J family partition protein, partial [Fibrobacterales bacterium]|nr:ParB/RepB/Spo0J family partition protein [Fibrobacterales bacterium]